MINGFKNRKLFVVTEFHYHSTKENSIVELKTTWLSQLLQMSLSLVKCHILDQCQPKEISVTKEMFNNLHCPSNMTVTSNTWQ